MAATGSAHPVDACPPLGSFVFWNTGRPAGHVSVVVQADPGCDPDKILVTANEVFDSATGNYGGVGRIVAHLGLAHTEAELGLLVAQARDLLDDDRQVCWSSGSSCGR